MKGRRSTSEGGSKRGRARGTVQARPEELQPADLRGARALPGTLPTRLYALADELASLHGIPEPVRVRCGFIRTLAELLAVIADSGSQQGTSFCLLYKRGRLEIRELGEESTGEAGPLEALRDNEPLLRRILATGKMALLPSSDLASREADDLLEALPARAALIFPFAGIGAARAALVSVTRTSERSLAQWQAVTAWWGARVMQLFALASALMGKEAAEAGAREQRAILDTLLRSAPELISHLELDGIVRQSNGLRQGVFRAQVVGSHWLSFVAEGRHEVLGQAFARAIANRETVDCEVTSLTENDATGWTWTRIAPLEREGEIRGAILIARDITDRKQAEAQLLVSERMAALGTLAAAIGHEINNPLGSVISNLDAALRDVGALDTPAPLRTEIIAGLDDARSAADRLRVIVKDLRLFSRSEDDAIEAVDVERALESSLRIASNELRHRAKVVKDYRHIPAALANESRLSQVFLNLLVNAAQAIPEGKARENVIRVSTTFDSEEQIVVSISDTGSGICPDVQRRLFRPFVTTKTGEVGTGLGLFICRRIVASFGGQLSFESQEGKGTTFRVALPPSPHEARPAARSAPQSSKAATRRGRVLLVDDDHLVGRGIKRLLAREHDVLLVDTATSAVEMLRRGDRFDVILCDLMMPQTTGMEIHAEIHGIDPGQATRLIFITGGAFTQRARKFLDSVPNKCLGKPLNELNLRAAVNALVQ